MLYHGGVIYLSFSPRIGQTPSGNPIALSRADKNVNWEEQTKASPDYVQWLVATKATRPRTRPGGTAKSSAKGLSPRAIRLQYVS